MNLNENITTKKPAKWHILRARLMKKFAYWILVVEHCVSTHWFGWRDKVVSAAMDWASEVRE